MGGQHWRLLALRLSVNPDGSTGITCIEESGAPSNAHRAQLTDSDANVKKFLQLVEKADFWSMPSVEPEIVASGRRDYKLDAGPWVFEGVRNGSYYFVVRRGPKTSPFTEMVHFLAKDLAKLDESTIPHESSGAR